VIATMMGWICGDVAAMADSVVGIGAGTHRLERTNACTPFGVVIARCKDEQ
jgi:hypothetical protein